MSVIIDGDDDLYKLFELLYIIWNDTGHRVHGRSKRHFQF